jgi:tRNA U55 pseudouridine synthase TruB
MKILTPGHKYILQNFENTDNGQTIQFIEKIQSQDNPAKLETVNDGTTNEEVLKMLIDRMQSLYNKFPSEETACSINHLKSALYAQQSRTYERSQRGVEGKHLK